MSPLQYQKRLRLQTAMLFVLLRWMHISGPFPREALVCASFPMATVVVLFAAKYKALEEETASILLLSTIALLVTVPVTLAIGKLRANEFTGSNMRAAKGAIQSGCVKAELSWIGSAAPVSTVFSNEANRRAVVIGDDMVQHGSTKVPTGSKIVAINNHLSLRG
jgi:hypothetical protein